MCKVIPTIDYSRVSRRRRWGGVGDSYALVAPRRTGSFPVITFPDCCLLPLSMVNCYLLPPRGLMAISCFLRELTEIAHGRDAPFGLYHSAGAAVRVGRFRIFNCYLLPSMRVNCYLLPSIPSRFLMAISCFSARAHGADAPFGLKNTVRAAFPTRQARCTSFRQP